MLFIKKGIKKIKLFQPQKINRALHSTIVSIIINKPKSNELTLEI